jgi:hypothetical protein
VSARPRGGAATGAAAKRRRVASKRPQKEEEEDDEESEEEEEEGSDEEDSEEEDASSGSESDAPATPKRRPRAPPAHLPSYLRSRFGDKGSSLNDAPPRGRRLELAPAPPQQSGSAAKPNGKPAPGAAHAPAGGAPDDEAAARPGGLTARRRGEGPADAPDNNILLFGRWFPPLRTRALPPPPPHRRTVLFAL